MYTQKRQQHQDSHSPFAVSVRRAPIVTLLTAALLIATVLQGCIHIQQPQETADITVYQPENRHLPAKVNAKPQVIGHFVIATKKNGAFLEGVQFKQLTQVKALEQVRIKMAGDDEWLSPSEINIFLYPQQEHYFEVAAVVTDIDDAIEGTIEGTIDDKTSNINFALTNFRFLKTDATTSMDTSTLTYSVAINSSDLRSPQQSRS